MTTILDRPFIRTMPEDGPPRVHGVCDACGAIEELGPRAQRMWAHLPLCRACEDAQPHFIMRRDAHGCPLE